MQLDLEGKVAIVTGGSKGIGRGAVETFLREGASVLACARGQEALDELAAAHTDAGNRLQTLSVDLSDPAQIENVVAECIKRFGRVDILVNNAGSARLGNFLDLDDEAWMTDYTLKFFGYIRMARSVFPHLKAQGSGVIINIIGVAAFQPEANYMIGGSANLALNHFTKALAQEAVQYGVRVLGVNPGPFATTRLELRLQNIPEGQTRESLIEGMSPMRRAGQPDEIGDLIAFLASPRAAFMTGTNIAIDGGANRSIMG